MSNQLDPITNLPNENKPKFDLSQIKFKNYSNLNEQRAYSQNNDYLSGVDPNVSGDTEKQQISDNQSNFEALRNTTGRLLGNIVPEVLRGVGYLEDVVTGVPDGNALTEAMNSWIDNVNEELPLYSSPNNKIINYENMSGLVNSMASFAVTGMGIGGILGKLGSIGGKVGAGLAQVGTATALTGIEGAMEANELLKNSYVQEYNKLLVQNLDNGMDEASAMMNADIKAKSNVESAAKTAMLTNYINVGLNLLSAGYFVKGGNPFDDVGRMVKNPANFFSKETTGKLALEGVQESLEEGVNVFAGAAGKNELKGKEYTFNNIWESVDPQELKTSMVLGAIGGIGQTALSIGGANMNTKWYKGKNAALREKYAEQKDFIDRMTQTIGNPTDQSKNVLSTTHNLGLLQQAQELEDAGNIEGAKALRSQAVAYNLYESFKNDTWKDFKDLLVNLSKKEELSAEQKEAATELANNVEKYHKIYRENTTKETTSSAPFSMYFNRVNHSQLEDKYNSLRKEHNNNVTARDKELAELNNLEISEKEKVSRSAEINAQYNPKLKNSSMELAELNKQMIELNTKYNELTEANLDILSITDKAKKALKKMFQAKKDLVYNANTDEELDFALDKFETQEEKDAFLEDAANRQTDSAKPIDFTNKDSVAKSLTERWTNKPALARKEKAEISNILGVEFTSINDLATSMFEGNQDTKNKIQELENQKQAELQELKATDNFDNFQGKDNKGNDVIFRGNKYYKLGGDKTVDGISNVSNTGTITKKSQIMDFILNKYNQLKKETERTGQNNIQAVKDLFESKDAAFKEKIKVALDSEEKSMQPLDTVVDNNTTYTIVPELNSNNENIPILHWPLDKDGKPNSKYDPMFLPAHKLLQTNELNGKDIYFETDKESIESIGKTFPNSSLKIDENNFIVYLVYYKDGNPENKNSDNRILMGKLRPNVFTSQNKEYSLSEGLASIRTKLLSAPKTDIISSGVSTKVDKILFGKISTTDNFISPLDVLKPSEQLILSIALDKGGNTDLDFGNMEFDKSNLIYDQGKLIKGAVYMMVKTPDDKYVPVQVRVNKLSELNDDKIKNRVIELVNKLEEPNSDITGIKRELARYVHYVSNILVKDGTVLISTRRNIDPTTGRNKRSADTYVTKEEFINILMNDLAKVDIREINRGSYNSAIASNGTITTNLSMERFTLGNIRLQPITGTVLNTQNSNDQREPITTIDLNELSNYERGSEDESDVDKQEQEEAQQKQDTAPKVESTTLKLQELFPSLAYTMKGFLQAFYQNQQALDKNNLRTEDEQFYLINKERWFRVSNILPKKFFSIGKTKKSISAEVGNEIDSIARKLLNNETVEKPANMTNKAFEELKDIIDYLQNNVFLSTDNSLLEPDRAIIYHDFGSKIGKIAGELDVMYVQPTGIAIYDFKTANSFADYDMSYRKQHSMQLSAYANILNAQYGVPISYLGIIPLEVNYDGNGNIIGIQFNEIKTIEYDSEVEQYIPRLTNKTSILEKEETPTSDLEAKKAEIERRRQEELKSEEYRITTSSELYQDSEGNFYKVEKLANGKFKVSPTDSTGKNLGVGEVYKTTDESGRVVTLETIINGGVGEGGVKVSGSRRSGEELSVTKIKDLEFTNKIVDKINAKYDAELAALEDNQSNQPKVEAAPVEDKSKTIGKSNKKFGKRNRKKITKQLVNVSKELENIKRILPGSIADKTKVVEEIERIGDITTYGIYQDAAITIIEKPEIGTGYHEAVHAVVDILLSPKEKLALLKEIEKTFKPTFEEISMLQELYPTATEKELYEIALEEELAEKFQYFAITKDTKNGGKHSVSLFNRIKYWVQNIFNIHNNKLTVDKFFNKLYDGGYRSRKPYKNKMGNTFAMFNANKMSPYEKLKRLQNLKYFYVQIISEYQSMPEYEGYKSVDIINKIGFSNLVNMIATRIVMDRNAALDVEDAEYREFLVNKYENFLNNFVEFDKFDNEKSIELNEELEFLSGSSVIYEFPINLDLPLMVNFINSLTTYGVSIKLDNKQNSVYIKREENIPVIEQSITQEDLEDTTEDGNQEDARGKQSTESWQTKANEVSSEKSFSSQLKLDLQTIPKPLSENDDLDYPTYEDYMTVRNFLIENIANTYSKELMLEKLEKLAPLHNFVQIIYDRAVNNPDFATDLFVYIAAKAESDYLLVKEVEKGDLRVIRSNRNNITMTLIEDIKSFFNSSKLLSREEKNGVRQINMEEAAKFDAQMKVFLNKFRNNDNYDKVNQWLYPKKELLREYSNFLREYSIDITYTQLESLSKLGKSEFFKLVDKLNAVNNYIKQGNNILSPNVSSDISEATMLEQLAKILVPVTEHKSEKSMTTVNNTVKFTHSNSNFTKKFISNITSNKNLLERYLNDPFYKESFLLKEILENESLAEKFNFLPMDGLSTEEKNVDFESMDPFDLQVISIAAFVNNGRSTAYYRAPVFSDSPSNGFFAYSKIINAHKSDEFWDKVYSTVLQEYNRIKFVEANKDIMFRIKNVSSRYKKYHLSPFMNNINLTNDINSKEGKAEVIELAKKYYEQEFQKEINKLFDLKILESSEIGITSKALGSIVRNHPNGFSSALMSNLSDYFYNSKLFNSQSISLFSGDPMFYKTDNDWSKRNKQVVSPVLYGDVSRVRPNYVSINFKDIEENALTFQEGFQDVLNKLFENHPDSEAIIKSYERSSFTDAQSFITIDRYKEILTMFERWTAKHEFIYNKIKNNKILVDAELENIYKDFIDIFGALKPFDFHHRFAISDTETSLDYIHPYQVKRAEFLLLPQVANQHANLRKMLDAMESAERSTGNTAVLNYSTAVKVGEQNTYNDQKTLELDTKNNNINVVELSNSSYGLQVEVPSHFVEDENNFGSQLMKLITADQDPNYVYTSSQIPNIKEIFGKDTVTHAELTDMYNELFSLNLKRSFNKLQGEMGNIKTLKTLLIRSGIQNQLQDEYFKVIGSTESKEFLLPLWTPPFGKTNESVLHSLLRNRVVKQKFPGAALVNVSSVGLNKKLKIVFNEDGSIKHFEAKLPFWTRKYFDKFLDDKTGEINYPALISRMETDLRNEGKTEEEIQKEIDSLLEVVAYRIPTEHKHSMFKIKVVGFMHPLAAGAIQLPLAATTISGFDFDIDKLYCMFSTFDNKLSKEKGYPVRKKYTNEQILNGNNDNDVRYNALLDIIKGFLSTVEAAKQTLEPSSFEDLKENAHRIYLASQGNDKAFSMDYKSVKSIIDNETMDLTNPSTQSEFIERNRIGKALIGFFANHNTCHAFAQRTTLSLKDLVVRFNGSEFASLNSMYDEEGRLISKTLGGSIAASTDNAKDPIASFMNLNIFTVDKYALLYRLGVSKNTAQLFMSQYILKALAKNVSKGGNTESVIEKEFESFQKLFDTEFFSKGEIKNQWTFPKKGQFYNLNDEKLEELLIESSKIEESLLKLDKMKREINSIKDATEKKAAEEKYQIARSTHYANNWQFYNAQYLVLSNFKKLMKPATELGNLSSGIKVDNVSNRSNLADIEMASIKYESISMINSLDGVDDFFDDKMLSSFYTYGLWEAKELFKEYFPYLNDGFKNIKSQFIDNLGLRENSKNLQRINYMILTALASDFEFFADDVSKESSKRSIVFGKLPDLITEYINDNLENTEKEKYVKLLRRFAIRERKHENISIESIEFYKNGLNSVDKQLYTDIMEEMLNEPEGSKELLIINNLIRYGFFKSGFTSDAMSFSTMIPVSFWVNLKDSKGNKFIDYLERKVKELDVNLDEQERIVKAIYSNSVTRPNFVNTVKKLDYDVIESNPTHGGTLISLSGKNVTQALTKSGKYRILHENNLRENDFQKFIFNRESGKLYQKVEGFTGKNANEVHYRLIPKIGLGPYSLQLGSERLSNYDIANNGFDNEFHSDLAYSNLFYNNTVKDKDIMEEKEELYDSLNVKTEVTKPRTKAEMDKALEEVFERSTNKKKKPKKLVDENQMILFDSQQSSETIYNRLGNKTVSKNIKIIDWENLRTKRTPIEKDSKNNSIGIVSTRILNVPFHFGNPFSSDKKVLAQNPNLIETNSTKESIEKYIDWIINSKEDRAQWIKSQLKSGKLKNLPIYYFKELGEPSHATALDYLINEYDWFNENPKTIEQIKEEPELIIIAEEFGEDEDGYSGYNIMDEESQNNLAAMLGITTSNIENKHKETLDYMIDNYDQKKDELKEIGINSIEDLRRVDVNDADLISKLMKIKC